MAMKSLSTAARKRPPGGSEVSAGFLGVDDGDVEVDPSVLAEAEPLRDVSVSVTLSFGPEVTCVPQHMHVLPHRGQHMHHGQLVYPIGQRFGNQERTRL